MTLRGGGGRGSIEHGKKPSSMWNNVRERERERVLMTRGKFTREKRNMDAARDAATAAMQNERKTRRAAGLASRLPPIDRLRG